MARNFALRRRNRQWGGLPGVLFTFTSAGTQQSPRLDFAAPRTIVRMLGDVVVQFGSNAIVAGDAAVLTLAIGIVSTDAAILGATAMPDPADEPDYPWLFWKSVPMFSSDSIASAGELTGAAGSSERVRVDVKSQRMVKPGQSLTWVGQYVDDTGTPAVVANIGQTRVLFLDA